MTLGVVSDPTAEEMRAQPQSAPEDLLGLPGNGPQHGKIDTQEHVAKLRGAQWHRVVIEMLRSSPSIATVSRELMSYLMSATWSVEGGQDGIAEFWREALGLEGRAGRMTTTFERALRGLAYALNGGFAYSEEMYYHADGRVWLDRLEWRDPRSHYRWITDQRGQVAGVEQWVTDASGRQWQTVIPVDRLALAVWDGDGYDYEGLGLLRPLWSHWRDQSHALQSMAVAVERLAVPAIHAQLDYEALRSAVDAQGDRVFSEDNIKALASGIQQQMRALRSVNKSVLVTPSAKFIEIAPLLGAQIDADMFERVIAIHEHRMTRAYLAQILDLGVTNSGSRSVGEVQERSAERFATNALEWLRDSLRPTLGRLTWYNFGDVAPADMPTLVFSGIQTPEFVRHLQALPSLAAQDLIARTPEVVQAMHRKLGLPVPEVADARPASLLRRPITAASVRGE